MLEKVNTKRSYYFSDKLNYVSKFLIGEAYEAKIDYKHDLFDRRNRIVHSGLLDFTFADAEQATKAAVSLIVSLRALDAKKAKMSRG